MPAKKGLIQSLNKLREVSSEIYHEYIPILTEDSPISDLAHPILNYKNIQNEFMSVLINRIVYTAIDTKLYNNPLQFLEGSNIPLGYAGQEIYVNPAQGRQFNVDDFAGLLMKYEADVKVQYQTVNSDIQYPVTVSRHKLKQAFTSWEDLDEFIQGIINSLYNGAYIDMYRFTKNLITNAYRQNAVRVKEITAPTTEELAKQFVTQARAYYLNFSTPSTEYNAWEQIGGYGRPITTWTEPDDIVFFIKNELRAFLDVNVLASAFNMDKTDLLGRIISVDNFNIYGDDGKLIYDGSNIVGMIADRNWFKIKTQDMYMDEFYNANNRTWQHYLNVTKMYSFSFFANAIVFATELPSITITTLDYNNTETIELNVNEKEGLDINVTPIGANTPEITYEVDNADIVSIETDENNDRHVILTGVATGEATLTATAGNVTTSIKITVSE